MEGPVIRSSGQMAGASADKPDNCFKAWTAGIPQAVRPRMTMWLAWIVLVLLAGVAAKGRGPWDPDELKYAQVAQGMRANGDLFVPQLWGEVYPDKPPLYFWLVLAASYVTGDVGLPALLAPVVPAACIGVWLVFRICTNWYGHVPAMLGPVLLTGLPLYLVGAQIGRMDMILTVCVTAAVYACYLGYVEQWRGAAAGAFAIMGLGVLAKGSFGAVFPVSITLVALWYTGKLRRLCRWETLLGILLFGLVLAVWWAPALASTGPGYLSSLLVQQTWGRAVFGSDHSQPVSFYLWVIPLTVLPWTLLLVPALGELWGEWRRRREDQECWLLSWLAVPSVILLLVREKMPIYLLPLMPPVAIVLARYCACLWDNPERNGRPARALAVTFGLVCFCGLVLTVSNAFYRWESLGGHVMLLGGGLLAGFGALGWWGVRRSSAHGFGILTAAVPALALFVVAIALPKLDGRKSWKAVAAAVHEVRGPSEAVATYQLRPYVGYFLHQSVVNFQQPDDLARLVQQQESVCCVVRPQHILAVQRYCMVENCHQARLPSPKGLVRVVRLRPLAPGSRFGWSGE